MFFFFRKREEVFKRDDGWMNNFLIWKNEYCLLPKERKAKPKLIRHRNGGS